MCTILCLAWQELLPLEQVKDSHKTESRYGECNDTVIVSGPAGCPRFVYEVVTSVSRLRNLNNPLNPPYLYHSIMLGERLGKRKLIEASFFF